MNRFRDRHTDTHLRVQCSSVPILHMRSYKNQHMGQLIGPFPTARGWPTPRSWRWDINCCCCHYCHYCHCCCCCLRCGRGWSRDQPTLQPVQPLLGSELELCGGEEGGQGEREKRERGEKGEREGGRKGGREGGREGRKRKEKRKGKKRIKEKRTFKTSHTPSSRLNSSHSDLSQYSAISWFKATSCFKLCLNPGSLAMSDPANNLLETSTVCLHTTQSHRKPSINTH